MHKMSPFKHILANIDAFCCLHAGTQQNFEVDVFEGYISQLQEILPVDKKIFLSKLKAFGLLSDDLKTKLKCIPASTDRAECFLDDVILPTLPDDTTNLDKLLSVMEASKDENMKKLAGEIRTKCYTV